MPDILLFFGSIIVGIFGFTALVDGRISSGGKAVAALVFAACVTCFVWAIVAEVTCPVVKTEIVRYQKITDECGNTVQCMMAKGKFYNLNKELGATLKPDDMVEVKYYSKWHMGVTFADESVKNRIVTAEEIQKDARIREMTKLGYIRETIAIEPSDRGN